MCVGFFILLFFACSSKHTSYNNNDIEYYGGNPMEFKSFKLVQTNMSAQQYVYEGYKTENGVHLEYYISTENWDYKTLEHAEFRNIVRKFDGDEKIFGKLCALFGRCKIIEWTDFHGCDSQVLDGTGMSFTAVLADGTEVNAQGTNSFPENFSTFTQELHKLLLII